MANIGKIILFLCCLQIGALHNGWATAYKWDQIVTFKGKIAYEKFYGPPNFGETPETDQKVEVPILRTEHPVDIENTVSGGLSSIKGQRKIQLIIRKKKLKKHDLCVEVTGTLFEAVNGHHHTSVLLDVDKIKPCAK